MNNPYKVLGVNEGASQEEIRSAYLKLVKKYHPDKYTDSDLKELANEKLVEVNEAYEMLTKKTSQSSSYASRNGNGTYDSYSGGYTGSGSSYSGPNAQEFNRARAFINQNNLQAAKAVLDAISTINARRSSLFNGCTAALSCKKLFWSSCVGSPSYSKNADANAIFWLDWPFWRWRSVL